MANAWRPVVVQRAAGRAARRLRARQLVEGRQQLLAVAEAFGRQVRRQLQGGDARARDGVVFEAERVVEAAERAAALADDGLLALVQLAADDHERRQLRPGSRAPAPPPRRSPAAAAAGQRLAVEADRRRAVLPVRPMVPATPWSLEPVCSERMMANWSASAAICGNSSPMRTPATFVAMGANGPRIFERARRAWGPRCRAAPARPTARGA